MSEKKSVKERYVTPKGELVGFIALVKPSTKFNKEGTYTCNILLSKEEGEYLTEKMMSIRTEQFKKYGKGTKVTSLPCKPYTITNEDTGESIPDKKERYILTATEKAYIEKGEIHKHIQIIDAKLQPVKSVNIGAGTIAKLGVNLVGYSVAGKTGVSAKLGLVQIIDLVEYSSGFSLEGFNEEEGYEFTNEDTTESEETFEGGEGEELDF